MEFTLKKPQKATKRLQVDKAKTKLFMVIAGVSVVAVFCLMASRALYSEAGYLNRVASAKETALDQLKKNSTASKDLVASYKEFANLNPNLIAGDRDGAGARDGDNGRIILDALPSTYDFPALATSIEELLGGYKINSITGKDETAVQTTTETAAAPVEIPFTLDAQSDFAGMQNMVLSFERSIRPFQFLSIELKGAAENNVQAVVSAKTFYLPAKDLKLGTKVIK